MNNSKIVIYSEKEELPSYEKRKGELSQIVEAINRVEDSEDWQKLKRLVLDDVVSNLERRILNETSKKEINAPELYRLQGELKWAKRYTNLQKLSEFFKLEIEGIKKLGDSR